MNITCSICLDECSSDYIDTECKHRFHVECISKWYDIKNSCPYCRSKIYMDLIRYITKNLICCMTYRGFTRKSVQINNITTYFIEKQLKYKNLKPAVWIDYRLTGLLDSNVILLPLYSIHYNNEDIYITAYTRLVLLYKNHTKNSGSGSGNIVLTPHTTIENKKYYTTNSVLKYIKHDAFLIMIEWFIELMHVLKESFDFEYYLEYNTIFCDLIIETIKNFNITQNNMLQGLIICAVQTILAFNNIDISLETLNEYTCNTYDLHDLIQYTKFQNTFLKDNVIGANVY